MPDPRVRIAFLWHLHQPDYRDPVGKDLALPWVRLHGTRGYTDLAFILEQHPEVKATVNITASLADQIEDLVHLRCGDVSLHLSKRRAEDLTLGDRIEILRGFFSVDWEKGVRPLPRYWALLHQRGRDLKAVDLEQAVKEFSDQDFRDLQVLFNLAWMGFAARQTEEVVKNLLRKGEQFTEVEKEVLLDCQMRLLAQVLPRWKALSDRGQVELTTTPYYHPILPLLLDTDSARCALPQAQLPPRMGRPGDAREQVRRALDAHARRFGTRPVGMWPAEGSVSPEAVALLAEEGVRWCASDEEVLARSVTDLGRPPEERGLYRPWQVDAGDRRLAMVFRDRQLSDRIGFAYAHNRPQQAVEDLLGRAAEIGRRGGAGGEPPLVSLILDGENPWEHYPESGRGFLEALHEALARGTHQGVALETVRLGDVAETAPASPRLTTLHAGSWIESCYRIWIGHPETNTAWQAVADAGRVLDARGGELAEANREAARDHLLAAEGSDWFWWYGDDFVAENPEVFDRLFRARLAKVYELTGEATPVRLRHPISQAALGAVHAAPLREPTGLVTPLIDGFAAPHIDWVGAGIYRPSRGMGTMFQGSLVVTALHWGLDLTELFLRLDLTDQAVQRPSLGRIQVDLLHGDRHAVVDGALDKGCGPAQDPDGRSFGRVCFGDIVEVSIPFEELGLPRGEKVLMAVHLMTEGVEIERLPRYGHLTLQIPGLGAGRSVLKA